jgi:Trk K+ transport system NAD-binding subunit
MGLVVGPRQAGRVEALRLPTRTRAVLLYREGRPVVLDPDTEIKEGDELVLVTHVDDLPALSERWPV